MKVLVDVSGVKELNDYIDLNIVPMIVCAPSTGVTSEKQREFLEKYYDKIVDKRGWTSYYCNIINASKCRNAGYESIVKTSGMEENIKDFKLKKIGSVSNKYVVVVRYASGKSVDSLELVKSIRLKTETKKKQINAMVSR